MFIGKGGCFSDVFCRSAIGSVFSVLSAVSAELMHGRLFTKGSFLYCPFGIMQLRAPGRTDISAGRQSISSPSQFMGILGATSRLSFSQR